MNNPTEKDALEFLVETGKKLTTVETFTFDGRQYTNKELRPMAPPTVDAIEVSTLAAVTDLCSGKFAAPTAVEGSSIVAASAFEGFDPQKYLIHVMNEKQVQVVAAMSDEWARRETLIKCQLRETIPFEFGKFMSQDKFVIGLMSCFERSLGDHEYLAKFAGSVTDEASATAVDDGVSQVVTTKAGAFNSDRAIAKKIVRLAPFRTFRDIGQPVSEFLFRIERGPTLALFEADGGKWRIEAIENIARYFRASSLKDVTIVS